MKIWFDLSNAPHVLMFRDMISQLKEDGHDIIITTRPLSNTVDLLNRYGMQYSVVGKHYGKSLINKILGYPVRIWQLAAYLKNKKPDLAVSQSSFHSPLVAKMLNIPSLYTNDNEHAMGNRLAFRFASKILVPESMQLKGYANKVIRYKGLKEGIYLWVLFQQIKNNRKDFNPSKSKIYIRPEPSTAQYYNGKHNFFDNLINDLSNKYSIVILPRNDEQRKHYESNFAAVTVVSTSIEFEKIATDCLLFIGAGGSMTREMALLGIPAISVYQDELLAVDKLLIENNQMKYLPNVKSADVEEFLQLNQSTRDQSALMEYGKESYQLMLSEILKFQNHD